MSTAVSAYQTKLESQYITPLTDKQSTIKTQVSSLGTLKTKIKTLYDEVKTLTKAASSTAYSVSSSDTAVATATAKSAASVGTHTLVVSRLAHADTIVSGQTTATDTTIANEELTTDEKTSGFGTRQIDITVGGTKVATVSVEVDAGDTNSTILTKIKTAINSSAAASSLTASVVTGTSGSMLKLTGKNTGSSNTISLSDVSGTLLDDIGLTDSVISGRTATSGTSGGYVYSSSSDLDSSFTLDGVAMTRTSNTVTDALDGVTLKFIGTTANSSSSSTYSTLTISLDTDNIKSGIDKFLTDYNDLLDYVKTQTTVSSDGTLPTFGTDSSVLNLRSNLQSILLKTVSGVDSSYNTLAKIGITMATDGSYSIEDSTKLDDALSDNPSAVAALFGFSGSSTSITGYADSMKTLLAGFAKTGGTIDSRTDILNDQLDSITSSIDKATTRVGKMVDAYQLQYAKLQAALVQAQEQQQSISSILSSVSSY
jgi:flagellar hook-associated protein 2